jgi:hypothetical protein
MNVGGLAQLGEHLLCKQGVVGSIPSSSTNVVQAVRYNAGLPIIQINTKAAWLQSQASLLLTAASAASQSAVL